MGMRMMFTVFLLVVLATTVVSFTSNRVLDPAFRRRNAAAKASDLIALNARRPECCTHPACHVSNPELCG
uniref:Alpha-conotoxin Mr1.7a n=1 Tax=Conus marmoreus TaxID=42752 RepID=CA18_CONMR|nr:RecName: Full=Alpha-conotoxin Mr1.7a; AltName: Full=Conotoxin Mr1.8; Contains: RecName: Full=Alpha-conotoxin MrIC; AltName: Full=Mr1.7c; Contains: RecName: Full=Alpha-conotoxin Mr1.7b; AltName: Full=Mr002; Flags: Precursor [Conus marmoreus]ADZ99331.1 conotoxin Mr1.8 [Conus marmoreus]